MIKNSLINIADSMNIDLRLNNIKMNYSIIIDHKLKLLKYKQSGLIYGEDIQEAWNEFLTLPEFAKLKYNLLSDYRSGKIQIPHKDLSEIINFMRKIEPIIRGKKQALIVDDPYSVAASMLFKNEVYKKVGFNVQVFTTERAALKWLSN